MNLRPIHGLDNKEIQNIRHNNIILREKML